MSRYRRIEVRNRASESRSNRFRMVTAGKMNTSSNRTVTNFPFGDSASRCSAGKYAYITIRLYKQTVFLFLFFIAINLLLLLDTLMGLYNSVYVHEPAVSFHILLFGGSSATGVDIRIYVYCIYCISYT